MAEQPPAAPPPPMEQGYIATRPTDGLAVAALVAGLIAVPAVPFCGAPGVVFGTGAIILGLRARGRVKRSGGAVGGAGIAMAGMILGACGAVLGALWGLYLLALYGAMMNWGGVQVTPLPSGPPQL